MSGGSAGVDRHDHGAACWSCRQTVDARAMFCHACGVVQPPRGQDEFQRLGLERRFDIDPIALDRQHGGFRARLAAERFADRGRAEQIHAARHRAALDEARVTLADPWRRALHLLELAGRPLPASAERDLSPAATAAPSRRAEASRAEEVEPMIAAAERRLEPQFDQLAAAFRAQDFERAAIVAGRIAQGRGLAAEARLRRAELDGG